jgi:hypothetical protein
MFEKSDEFWLSLAAETLSDDLTGSGVESGKQIQCPIPTVFMFHPVRGVARLCRFGSTDPGARLKRRFLIDREDDLEGCERSGVEINDHLDPVIESIVARMLG